MDTIATYAQVVRARMTAERDEPRKAAPFRAAEMAARLAVLANVPMTSRGLVIRTLDTLRDGVGTAGYEAVYGTRESCQDAQNHLALLLGDARRAIS